MSVPHVQSTSPTPSPGREGACHMTHTLHFTGRADLEASKRYLESAIVARYTKDTFNRLVAIGYALGGQS